MTGPERKDPRELEALRHEAEQELLRRNQLRASILVSEGFTPGASEQQVADYLNTNDEALMELIKDPDFQYIDEVIHLTSIGKDTKEQEKILEYENDLLTEYLDENPKFAGLSSIDPVIYKDVFSVSRVSALLRRKITGNDPIERFSIESAEGLLADFRRLNIPVSDSIKKVVPSEDIKWLSKAWDTLSDDSEQAENRMRQLKKELGIGDLTYEERLAQMEADEKTRKALTRLDQLIPDFRRFAEQVLNAKDGRLPV